MNHKNWITLLLFLFISLFSSPLKIIATENGGFETVEIEILSSVYDSTSDTTTYQIYLKNDQVDVYALNVDMSFDSVKYPFVSIKYDQAYKDYINVINSNLENEVRIAIATGSPIKTTGKIFDFVLKGDSKDNLILRSVVLNEVQIETIPIKELNLNQYALILKPGDSFKIEYSIVPESAFTRNISWSTSDETIVRVDPEGTITALNVGICSINVSINGTSLSKTVTIQVVEDEKTTKDLPTQAQPYIDREVFDPATVDTSRFISTFDDKSYLNIIDSTEDVETTFVYPVEKDNKSFFVKLNENNTIDYTWMIPFERDFDYRKLDFNIEAKSDEVADYLKMKGLDISYLALNLDYEGKLPEGTILSYFIGDYFTQDQALNLYYFNPEVENLELIESNIAIVEGYVELHIKHASSYLLTAELIVDKSFYNWIGLGMVTVLSLIALSLYLSKFSKIPLSKQITDLLNFLKETLIYGFNNFMKFLRSRV